MNIEIANRLVGLRKKNNLSQEQLAEKIGVSRQAVSKWERSEASPDTDNLIMLARLYMYRLTSCSKPRTKFPPTRITLSKRIPRLKILRQRKRRKKRLRARKNAIHSKTAVIIVTEAIAIAAIIMSITTEAIR